MTRLVPCLLAYLLTYLLTHEAPRVVWILIPAAANVMQRHDATFNHVAFKALKRLICDLPIVFAVSHDHARQTRRAVSGERYSERCAA